MSTILKTLWLPCFVLCNTLQFWFQSLKSSALSLRIPLLRHNKLKLAKRNLERRPICFPFLRRSLTNLRSATNHYHAAIIMNLQLISHFIQFYQSSSTLENCQHILHHSSLPALPSYDSRRLLSQSFAKLCSNLIHKLHTSLLINRTSAFPYFPPPFTPPNFSSLTCVTSAEVSMLLSHSPDTNRDFIPMPIHLDTMFSYPISHSP